MAKGKVQVVVPLQRTQEANIQTPRHTCTSIIVRTFTGLFPSSAQTQILKYEAIFENLELLLKLISTNTALV